jgi:hypothetical protein
LGLHTFTSSIAAAICTDTACAIAPAPVAAGIPWPQTARASLARTSAFKLLFQEFGDDLGRHIGASNNLIPQRVLCICEPTANIVRNNEVAQRSRHLVCRGIPGPQFRSKLKQIDINPMKLGNDVESLLQVDCAGGIHYLIAVEALSNFS